MIHIFTTKSCEKIAVFYEAVKILSFDVINSVPL